MKKTVIVLSLLIAGMNVNAQQQQIVDRAKDIANPSIKARNIPKYLLI